MKYLFAQWSTIFYKKNYKIFYKIYIKDKYFKKKKAKLMIGMEANSWFHCCFYLLDVKGNIFSFSFFSVEGPGCSSVGYGATEEIGPFLVDIGGRGLTFNNFSWNRGITVSVILLLFYTTTLVLCVYFYEIIFNKDAYFTLGNFIENSRY